MGLHHLQGVVELAPAYRRVVFNLVVLAGSCMGTTLKGLHQTAGGAQAPG